METAHRKIPQETLHVLQQLAPFSIASSISCPETLCHDRQLLLEVGHLPAQDVHLCRMTFLHLHQFKCQLTNPK